MEDDKNTVTSDWAATLGAASRVLKAASKFSTDAPDDPFEARHNLQDVINKLRAAHLDALAPPAELMQKLDAECTREKAEFWSQFSTVCAERGWQLDGSTGRRLLNRSLFVEATDDGVMIETLPATQTFHVPTVVKTLDSIVGEMSSIRQDPRHFLELVQRAFDSVGGGGERPIEEVYRGVLWHAQKVTFWKTLSPQQFVRITRPQFRSLLTQVLQLGVRTPDDRELRFGTTIQAKEAWEIYSPGEGRVVQVGRLSLS